MTKAENNAKSFESARERAMTSFFAVMRPRLEAQNLMKYGTGKQSYLDRDLQVLQRALENTIPDNESDDWKLPLILEKYENSHLRGNIFAPKETCS